MPTEKELRFANRQIGFSQKIRRSFMNPCAVRSMSTEQLRSFNTADMYWCGTAVHRELGRRSRRNRTK